MLSVALTAPSPRGLRPADSPQPWRPGPVPRPQLPALRLHPQGGRQVRRLGPRGVAGGRERAPAPRRPVSRLSLPPQVRDVRISQQPHAGRPGTAGQHARAAVRPGRRSGRGRGGRVPHGDHQGRQVPVGDKARDSTGAAGWWHCAPRRLSRWAGVLPRGDRRGGQESPGEPGAESPPEEPPGGWTLSGRQWEDNTALKKHSTKQGNACLLPESFEKLVNIRAEAPL